MNDNGSCIIAVTLTKFKVLLQVCNVCRRITGKRDGQQKGQRGMVERLRNVVRRHRGSEEGAGAAVTSANATAAGHPGHGKTSFGSVLPISCRTSRSRSSWETPARQEVAGFPPLRFGGGRVQIKKSPNHL